VDSQGRNTAVLNLEQGDDTIVFDVSEEFGGSIMGRVDQDKVSIK
jgi:hypothetical protein